MKQEAKQQKTANGATTPSMTAAMNANEQTQQHDNPAGNGSGSGLMSGSNSMNGQNEGAQNHAILNASMQTPNLAINNVFDPNGEESAVISQMQYLATASAPGSLSIDTSSAAAGVATTQGNNNLTHPSKGHKVATPSTAFQFATSPSILAAAKTFSSQVNYAKNANALFTASPAKSLASPTHSIGSNSSSDSSVASAGVKLMVGNMVLRKRESIAFFIDLLSPDSQNLKQTKYTGYVG